jgi:hypothetical protein
VITVLMNFAKNSVSFGRFLREKFSKTVHIRG